MHPRIQFLLIFIACTFGFLLGFFAPQACSQVKLTWDANTESDLSGYKVYYGLASRSYVAPIDVRNVTAYVLDSLELGNEYFFAVTAYDWAGNESGFSDEVSVMVWDFDPPKELVIYPKTDSLEAIITLVVDDGHSLAINGNRLIGSNLETDLENTWVQVYQYEFKYTLFDQLDMIAGNPWGNGGMIVELKDKQGNLISGIWEVAADVSFIWKSPNIYQVSDRWYGFIENYPFSHRNYFWTEDLKDTEVYFRFRFN